MLAPLPFLYTINLREKHLSISGGYMTLTGSFSLKEGNQYGFTVKDGSTIIYRGIIFCTDQTNLDRYTVNSGEYTHETSHDNEFVVI